MSADMTSTSKSYSPPRRPSGPTGAAGGARIPPPSISESAKRQDDLDNRQFEQQAETLLKPTTLRPALIVEAEVAKIRAEYTTGNGRLNVLGKVTGKRLDYWNQQQGGGEPFDPITADQRAKAEKFFSDHGVRLADEPRVAPPNPLRKADPPPEPTKAEPAKVDAPAPQALPDAIGGAVRGPVAFPPPATLEIEYLSSHGFACRLTLHASTGTQALEQGAAAMAKLVAQKAQPVPAPVAAVVPAGGKAEPDADATPMCAIHHTPMAKRQGKNGSFWSCPQKLEDGSWCPYKPPAK